MWYIRSVLDHGLLVHKTVLPSAHTRVVVGDDISTRCSCLVFPKKKRCSCLVPTINENYLSLCCLQLFCYFQPSAHIGNIYSVVVNLSITLLLFYAYIVLDLFVHRTLYVYNVFSLDFSLSYDGSCCSPCLMASWI